MKTKRLVSIFIIVTFLMSFIPVFSKKAEAETLQSNPQIAAGGYHTVALKQDGTVWSWGYNSGGQLGDGTISERNTPVQVQGLSGVVSIAAGGYHTVVLKQDGTVWAWGANSRGELGDGTNVNKNKPVQVQGLSGVVSIAAGWDHTVALKQDGTVWAWGYDFYGQLGDRDSGPYANKNKPVQVQGLNGVVSIAAGWDHTVALKQDGTVWAWGNDGWGQIGDGASAAVRNTPEQVQGFSGVASIAAGGYHTLALKQDGTVWVWGYNYYGQLGDGTAISKGIPEQMQGFSGVASIAAGGYHTLALKQDGTVWVWGRNEYGQLGDGTIIDRNIPEQVQGLSRVVSIAAKGDHTAALKQDGTVWTWGWNCDGQLGDGTYDSTTTPVQVSLNLGNPSVNPYDHTYSSTTGCLVLDADTCQPIADASVELGGNIGTTDSNGYAAFNNVTSGKYDLRISKTGYCDYIIDNYNYNADNANIYYLKQNNDPTKPYISSVILNDANSNTDLDILSQEKDYRIEKDSHGYVTSTESCSIRIKASGYSTSSPKEYILLQDGKTVLSNNTGEFNNIIPAELFQADIPIWVMVKYEDGMSTTPVSTKLVTFESIWSPHQNFKINLGNKIGLTFPDDTPFFGGSKCIYGFDAFEASGEFDKDTFKIAIGVNDITNVKDNWDEFKSIINVPIRDKVIAGALKGQFNTSDGIGFSLPNNIKGDCDVLGYIEGKIVAGELVTIGGKIHIKIGAKASAENQYYAGPVPVVVTVEIGANVVIDKGITYDSIKQAIIPIGETTLTLPHLEIGGGVGFTYYANVRAYGSGDMQFLNDFADNYCKASITASAGIKAEALGLEYKKEWLKDTWVLYDGYNTQSAQTNPVGESSPLNIYDKSKYSLADRNYIKYPSVWITEPNKEHSIVQSDYSNQEIRTLQTNIYPDAQPKMAVIGDKQVMVWLADNTNRTSANRTMLVYSVYDKTADTWSTPHAVNDDQTADFYPTIASDGSNLYVAWQNSKEVFSDSATMDEMAAGGEIETAKFDSEANTFDAPEAQTNNSVLDTQPQLAVDNGKAAVVWTSNSSSDIFGTTGGNSILYSELNGTEWSSPAVLVDNQKSIVNLSTGYLNGNLTTAFATDDDNDLSTLLDRDIYVIKPGQTLQRLTDNQVLDSNPTFGMFNGQKALYWYSDANIEYLSNLTGSPSTVFSSPVVGLSDNFKVVNNNSGKTAIIWTKNENSSAEIYSSIYDSAKNVWSDGVKISNVGADVEYPNGIFDDSGNLLIAFNRITTTDTLEQSDLCTVSIVPSYNLTVDNVLYDDTKVTPNGTLPIEIHLTNKGELGVDNINVDVLDGTSIISSTAVQQTIKPGVSVVVNTSFVLPSSISKKNYTIKVTPAGGTEYDLSDNSKDITVGYTDLGMKVDRYYSGDKQMAAVTVYNSSYMPSGAVIKVRENTPDGTVLASKTVDSLAYGESALSIFEIDPESLNYADDTKALYFTVEPVQDELRTGDNSDYITVNKPKFTVTFDSQGGSFVTSETVDYNSIITAPAVPTKTGYTFGGWYKEADYINAWNFSTDTVTSDIILYAKWTAIPVTGVTLDKTSATLKTGSSLTLTATVAPSDAADKSVIWTSSNTSAVTVNSTGKVTAVGNGVAAVTVKTVDGGYTAKCLVAAGSDSYIAVCNFVTRLYQLCLGRMPDESGLKYWANGLVNKTFTGAAAANNFISSKEFISRNVTDSQYIDIMYKAFFNRTADSSGKAYWMARLANGNSRLYVLACFVNSAEFNTVCTNYGINRGSITLTKPQDLYPKITEFVYRLYVKCLGRKPDDSGLNYYVSQLATGKMTGTSAAYNFVFSTELTSRNLSNKDFVTVLYRVFFNREPDAGGLSYYVGKLSSGSTRASVFYSFASSAEFASICSSYGIKVK